MSHLVIKQINKSFGNHAVLKNLSLTVNDGEFVSILGPSGSGKSTLFRLIGGISLPDNGDIYLDEVKINGRRGSISYMPQSPALLPWRSILKNVVLGAELHGPYDKKIALQMIERAGLKGYENHYPYELSGGMQQRVSFIRALLSPQKFMCLDEPFSALDEFTRLDMQKWLMDVWSEYRRSILFVTHNIEEAIFLSDRIIILSERPATVKHEFVIPFPRPRHEGLLLTEEFLHFKKKVYEKMQK
ncbi:MAG TPA: ABC transporter ATP-binding protein [Cerasibacillus sp.]|uniref:ABC transporter ATP-binding protein n=1 Tax=Cerasibacillus sp. TaxID=2498711 RepID=UPI002F3EA4FB